MNEFCRFERNSSGPLIHWTITGTVANSERATHPTRAFIRNIEDGSLTS